MIVQDFGVYVRLVTQHDHGLISGVFAAAWRDPESGRPLSPELALAVALHDVGWVEADRRPLVNEESSLPYDFLAYPDQAKVRLYEAAVLRMAAEDPYAALLHSLHFTSFVPERQHPGYHARQSATRAALERRVIDRGGRVDDLPRDLELLRLLDVFSLVLCMTAPGTDPASWPAWLTPSPLMHRRSMSWRWSGDELLLDPLPFERELEVVVPFRQVARDARGRVAPGALYAAAEQHVVVRVRGPR